MGQMKVLNQNSGSSGSRVAEVCFLGEGKHYVEKGLLLERLQCKLCSQQKEKATKVVQCEALLSARIVPHGKQKKLLADHQTVPSKMSLFCKKMCGFSLCTLEDLISNRVWVFQVTSKHLKSLQCIFSICFDYIFTYCCWHSHI